MANFTESVGWKKFMAKLYGLGAAIVIAGALFKLMHWPGAGIMLTIGMTTEAIIFIFSAFEPLPHPDPHWELVYPELAAGSQGGQKVDHGEDAHKAPAKREQPAHAASSGGGGGGDASALVAVGGLDLSGIDTKKLTEGINKLGQTADKLNDLSAAVAAANQLSENMKQASKSVSSFSESYEQSSQVLSESVSILSGSYQQAAETVITSSKQAGDKIIDATKQVASVADAAADSFAATFSAIDQQVKVTLDELKHGNTGYSKHLEALNKNMTALNSVYEMQAHETAKYQKNSVELGKQLESFVADLHKSAEENQAFRKGITHLNESIVELNTIYGNMLSAVHSATKKK